MIDFNIADSTDLVLLDKKYPLDAIFFRGKQNDDVILWFGFRLVGDKAEILEISARSNDDDLLFFCGRAGLNALDLSGIKNIFCENKNLKDILLKLGFNKNENIYNLTLTDDYFKAGCCRV